MIVALSVKGTIGGLVLGMLSFILWTVGAVVGALLLIQVSYWELLLQLVINIFYLVMSSELVAPMAKLTSSGVVFTHSPTPPPPRE